MLAEAESKGGKVLYVRVDPKVNVYAPNAGKVTLLESGHGYVQYEIRLEKRKELPRELQSATTRNALTTRINSGYSYVPYQAQVAPQPVLSTSSLEVFDATIVQRYSPSLSIM